MYDSNRARAEEIVDKKIKFYRNLKAYIITNTILLIINWIFTAEFWWVAFPLFFWGIGVIKDFLNAYIFINSFESEDYRERKIKEEIEKLQN